MAWQKGQSGNPNGRPPAGESIAERLRELSAHRIPFTDPITGDQSETTYTDAILKQLLLNALNGDHSALRLFLQYTIGRPPLAPQEAPARSTGIDTIVQALQAEGIDC